MEIKSFLLFCKAVYESQFHFVGTKNLFYPYTLS